MGIFNDAKAGVAAKHAFQARQAGRTVFVYRFCMPTSGTVSAELDGAGQLIAEVEAQGWGLAQMAEGSRQGGHGSLILLFRPGR